MISISSKTSTNPKIQTHTRNRKSTWRLYFPCLSTTSPPTTKPRSARDYVKSRATVADQARCKYQLSNEGNDVATGLKWQLYTDSVVLMPAPTMETWALEGALEPFVHYVPVKRDWSDLEARLTWAEAHPAAAANISANARAHVLKTLGASAASERRVVMAVLRGYRQALACAQPA